MSLRLPPAATALLLQILAALLGGLSAWLLPVALPLFPVALLCGLYAALLSHFAGLARWWLPIQFAFIPALVLMLAAAFPPELYLAAFLLLLLVYWSTFRSQVPLYLSSRKVWQALESLLPAAPFHFVDLGSGLGGVLAHLSRVRPDGQYHGVEAAPLPLLWSWLRLLRRPNCHVHWGSLWDCDLSRYDVVFAYLSPVPMERLWHKAKQEMRPGSLFISSTFQVPGQTPQQTVEVNDLHHSTLLVWRM